MESPKSEKVDTRFSTPVSALDDHRQPLPTTSPIDIPARNNSNTLQVAVGAQGNSYDSMPIARDFEHTIVEDDPNGLEGEISQSPEIVIETPEATRVYRRMIQATEALRDDASTSDRSCSPPNSIDAFAQPRRRERANTFGSRGHSDLEGLHRTVSDVTQRRPTFDNHSARPSAALAEEAGCDAESAIIEDSRIPRIDYEALAEFVAESRQKHAVPPLRKKYSFSSQGIRPQSDSRGFDFPNQAPLAAVLSSDIAKIETNGSLYCQPPVEKHCSGSGGSEKSLDIPAIRGSEQDRFSFFSSEIEKTIHTNEIGGLLEPGETFRDLFELSLEVGSWWLDVTNPTHDEMEMFQKAFGIHPLTTEDIEQKETREKVELFNTYYFVCFRSYHSDPQSEEYLEPINLYMIVFREGILSFAYSPNPHAGAVRRKIGKLKNSDSLTADWICYAMVDNIVDFYFPIIRMIEVEADQIEDQVFVARAEDFSQLLRQIGECRKKIMSLMRLLGGKADVIKGFAKRCNAQYTVTPRGEIGLYLSDIQDHVVTMMSNLGHFEKMLGRSHSNYLAQLSVDNLVQGNRANNVLSRITYLATVLVPLNLICGLFGMNVAIPGSVNEGSYGLFGGIIGAMAFVIIGSFIMAKRLRFI